MISWCQRSPQAEWASDLWVPGKGSPSHIHVTNLLCFVVTREAHRLEGPLISGCQRSPQAGGTSRVLQPWTKEDLWPDSDWIQPRRALLIDQSVVGRSYCLHFATLYFATFYLLPHSILPPSFCHHAFDTLNFATPYFATQFFTTPVLLPQFLLLCAR